MGVLYRGKELGMSMIWVIVGCVLIAFLDYCCCAAASAAERQLEGRDLSARGREPPA